MPAPGAVVRLILKLVRATVAGAMVLAFASDVFQVTSWAVVWDMYLVLEAIATEDPDIIGY